MDDTERNDVESGGAVAASGTTDPMSNIARETIQSAIKQAAADVKAELKAEAKTKAVAAKAAREAKAKAKAEEKAKKEAEAKAKAEAMHGDWRNKLIFRSNGTIEQDAANATTILANDAQWQGVLAWNEFTNAVVCLKKPPWHADDDDGTECKQLDETNGNRLRNWFVRTYRLKLAASQCYAQADIVSKKNRFHPIRDYLRPLRWDGVPRIETWLIRLCGAADTPYVRMVSRFFLVSAVARVMDPGCKVDTMLILEGLQGKKKSATFRTLFSREWFSDAYIDWNTKDRFEALRGKWCVEMAELAGMRKADVEKVKGYLSAEADDYRRPYGKAYERAERQCVFGGTVNPNALGTYLRDDENRRFWPVKCTKNADLKALAAERDQLWAEAFLYYQSENEDMRRWWPETEEEKQLCAEQVEERRVEDPWQGVIEEWLERPGRRDKVTVNDVLELAVKVEPSKMMPGMSERVASCLQKAGWTKAGRPRNGEKPRSTAYERPKAQATEVQTAQAQATEAQAEHATDAGDDVPPFTDYSHVGR